MSGKINSSKVAGEQPTAEMKGINEKRKVFA